MALATTLQKLFLKSAPPIAHAMTVSDFIRQYRHIVLLHSKRSPRTEELNQLFSAGLQLQAKAELRGRSLLPKILEPLGSLAQKLEDYDRFVELFEKALAQDVTLRTSHASMIIKVCESVTKIRDRTLRERVDGIRATVLAQGDKLSPDVRSKLSIAGKPRAATIANLSSSEGVSDTPLNIALLADLLIDECEKRDQIAKFMAAISYIDENFELLRSEGESERLITRLSILIAAKKLFLAAMGHPSDIFDSALDNSAHIDRKLFYPLQVVSDYIKELSDRGRPAYDKYIWNIANNETAWKYEYEGGEALRALVFDSLLVMLASRRSGPASKHIATLRLFRRMGQCEAFWDDDINRTRTLQRFLAVLKNIPEPKRTVFRGHCHLALNEQNKTAELYSTRRSADFNTVFNGSGHVTFISNDQALEFIQGPPPDLRFSAEACDVRFVKLPEAGAELTVVSCADPGYLTKHYNSYVNSLFKCDSRSRVHFHLMGRIEDVSNDVMSAIEAEPRVSLSSEVPPLEMPFYYATARFLRAPFFMKKLGGDIVLTDIDIRYSSAPHALAPSWRSHGDVGMRLYDRVRSFGVRHGFVTIKTPKIETWSSLNASCLFLKNSENARRVADDLSRVSHCALATFQDSGNSNWWIDQNIIFAWMKPALERTPHTRIFNLLEVGIPFGMFQVDSNLAIPPRGHHPAMPVL